jgi:glycosyltransferase involved in cell wall biosynthesis
MTVQPEISVIIPSYNGAKFIKTAVESVLQQGIPSVEIVIVDDGSTDGTKRVLQDYRDKGLVTYISQENKGPAAARNLGMRISKGEFICFLDADDILYPNSIQDRADVYKKYPELGLVFTDNKKVLRKNGKDVTYRENDLRETNFLEEIASDHINLIDGDIYLLNKGIFYELVLHCFIWTGTVMIRRSVLNDIGYFDEELKIAEDHDLWLRICRKYKIGFLNKTTAAYIMHNDGITTNTPLYYDSSIKVRSHYANELPKLYRDRLEKQLAMYSFTKGYYYYRNALYGEANRAFRQALSQNPLSVRYHLYWALTLLPEFVIKPARIFKRLLPL